ncbi:hypothetical protein B14911_16240 [Bacillus sp. NRRL B-14911]|uniref:Uncharacterized protein n=1 Tax=Bacillus infantis NRRL B-14911 TaxID=1367477 RepID=U5L658_9BACI|nr:hypothetical protein N288_04690 [Bacillus infantis NRRL B-14911]EAR67079.1 hypothetical protein B14911_16240 [Bacillus sp. NRRL B-14911]
MMKICVCKLSTAWVQDQLPFKGGFFNAGNVAGFFNKQYSKKKR